MDLYGKVFNSIASWSSFEGWTPDLNDDDDDQRVLHLGNWLEKRCKTIIAITKDPPPHAPGNQVWDLLNQYFLIQQGGGESVGLDLGTFILIALGALV